ncbi:acyl carrier protein [Serratia sp. 2723]|uniref:acyl carrier protein n=1 Tax=unclassified Serratia (in: enterobacteria) TaxID=2647522 RepID=UPI003D1905FC
MRKELSIFLKNIIDRLTDVDVDSITDETKLEELELVSLDFVTIKVEAKKEFGIEIDLNSMAEADIETFGQLMDYLVEHYSKETQ